MWHSLQRFLLLIPPLTLGACLFLPDERVSQGGGSDTETLSGILSLNNGQVAARTQVKLVPANYNPSKPDTTLIRKTVSDDNGQFNFSRLDKGIFYNLIAGIPSEHSWVFADSLKPNNGPLTLALTRARTLLISLEYAGYEKKDSGLAYFPGTDILTHCNGINASLIDSLPIGVKHIVVTSRAGWSHDTTLVNIHDSTVVKADRTSIKWLQ